MSFSIGGFEVVAVVVCALAAVVLGLGGGLYYRWPAIASASLLIAACLTPADLLSTLVLATVLVAAYGFGRATGATDSQSCSQ